MTRPPRARAALALRVVVLPVVLLAVAASGLSGCLPYPTEVVVVVDTDVTPAEFGSIVINVANFGFSQCGVFQPSRAPLPATLGVMRGGSSNEFDVTVQLLANVDPPCATGGGGPKPPGGLGGPTQEEALATRSASHVRFVDDEREALFLPIRRACLCNGTNCPVVAGCGDLIAPPVSHFDPDSPPRL